MEILPRLSLGCIFIEQHNYCGGRYEKALLASGAQGGTVTFLGTVGDGGRGTRVGGDFSLTAGERLQIAVGRMGSAVGSTSSGGGSFVIGPDDTPLLIAGGGGGAGRLDGAGRRSRSARPHRS